MWGGARRSILPLVASWEALSHQRCVHSTSYVQANLKAEERSEGKHGMASCRNLVGLRGCCALRRADARLASGDTGIALVACGLAPLSLQHAERGEGTARQAADVADMAWSIPEKSPFRGSKLRLGQWVHYLREACLVVLLLEPSRGAARRGRIGCDAHLFIFKGG
jgi:hypothetical protein